MTNALAMWHAITARPSLPLLELETDDFPLAERAILLADTGFCVRRVPGGWRFVCSNRRSWRNPMSAVTVAVQAMLIGPNPEPRYWVITPGEAAALAANPRRYTLHRVVRS
jgi:hypothetical protein